jgi:hypothetical protein
MTGLQSDLSDKVGNTRRIFALHLADRGVIRSARWPMLPAVFDQSTSAMTL